MRNVLFVLLLVAASYGLAFASDGSEQGTVKQRLGQYLAQQIGGLFDVWEKDQHYVTFSPQRQQIENKRDPDFSGSDLSITADNIIVIKDFEVSNLRKIAANRYVVEVKIHQVATTTGEGDLHRRILKNAGVKDIRYDMVLKSGRWMVLDPPPPLISISAIISFYEQYVAQMASFINKPKTSQPQKDQYKVYVDSLKTLKTIKD